MKHTGTKALSWLLSLAMLFSVVPGLSLTAYADNTETLLTTITATGTTTYDQSKEGVVTVTLTNIISYHGTYGWLYYGTITVEPVEGYTITKCRFIQNAKTPLDDDLAPFSIVMNSDDSMNPCSVTTSTGQKSGGNMDGVTSIEVYGYATPAASYSVTYNTNGGTINSGNITEYTEGTGATLPTDVTKEGYVFGGWYDNEGLTGSSVSVISETDTGNREYWAKWFESLVGKTYPVDGTGNLVIERATRFADGQGSTCTVSPGTYAISFDNLTDSSCLYRLSGNKIYVTNDTTKRIKALTVVEGTGLPGNPYVFAFLYDNPISCMVTFKVVNGSWDDDSTADKTVTLTGYEGDTLKLAANQIPAVGTKPNDTYKAGSWDTTPSTDTVITAVTTYTYTYVAKEASVVTKAPEAKTLTYNGQAQELVTAGTSTGGTMYYAVATDNTAPTDESLYTTSIPTKTDAGTYYVWYKVVGDDNHNDTAAACVTVTIAEKIYTVTFDSNGGSAVAAQTVTSGGKAAKPADPTNGDLHFMGWFVNPTLETLYDESGDTPKLNTFNFDTEITEDLTLKALWVAQMTVNTLGGGGRIDVVKSGETPELDDEYPMQSAVMNAVLGIYDSFTLGAKAQDGNRFVNWVRQTSEDNYEDYSTDAQINVTVTEDLSLYAVFEPTVFTIMYDSNGGSYVDSQTDADALPDPLPVPTQSGYTFGGWFTDSDLTTAAVPGASITENTLLYAKWNAVPVPVYSDDGDDTPPVTTVTVPVSGDDEKVNVTVRVSGDTATVTTANVDKVLAAEEVGTVTIDVSALKESVSEVVLPAAMVTKIVDAVADQENNADSLEIKLPAGTVTFDADAVAAIGSQAEGRSLRLNLEDIGEKKLNSVQKAAVEELDVQEVLDAYMTAGGQRIRDFRGGKATVTVPYELKAEQRAAGLMVWYVADDGEKTEMPSTYDGKDVKFTVEHFSNYVIAYDEQRAAACPRDETCPVSAFTDTDPGAWYHDGVHYALEKGLMNGVGDNQFDPNGTASRGMIVTILYRMEGEPEAAAENPFGDEVDGQWYTNAVIWSAENKIVDGYGGGKFGPNDHITREQLVTVMYRYARYKGVDVSVGEDTNILSYDDAFDVSEWAIPAMQWAVGSGTVEGRTETTLNPKDTATRAEIATIIMKNDWTTIYGEGVSHK